MADARYFIVTPEYGLESICGYGTLAEVDQALEGGATEDIYVILGVLQDTSLRVVSKA
jgi:hypothetical protein